MDNVFIIPKDQFFGEVGGIIPKIKDDIRYFLTIKCRVEEGELIPILFTYIDASIYYEFLMNYFVTFDFVYEYKEGIYVVGEKYCCIQEVNEVELLILDKEEDAEKIVKQMLEYKNG